MDEYDSNTYLVFLESGLYRPASVEEEPSITLYDWKIIATNEGYFFAGNTDFEEGRVSTDIVTFDSKTKRGVTKSGRVYQLVGPEAVRLSGDAQYVWDKFKAYYNLVEVKPKESEAT